MTTGYRRDTATELWQMSALEIGAEIRGRRCSSREAVTAHLERIESVNPAINAVTAVQLEAALAAADTADRLTVTGAELPPFHGVPFTVKESIDLLGAATTMGLAALSEAFPTADAPAVERLRAAGGIPIGHTNCPTITVRWHTDSELWGPTVNPWDAARTPGASSGGEAAALATGMSPLGLGSDGLGSLRWPAQCCGVTTLKPTLGRIPGATSVEPMDAGIGIQLTSVVGPMARRVADLRAAFETMSGPTWRDPWTVPVAASPPSTAPPPVAVVTDPGGGGVDPAVREGVLAAARSLEAAGYPVDEIEPPEVALAGRILVDMVSTPDLRTLWTAMEPLLPPATRRFMADFYAAAGDPDPATVMQCFVTRQSLLRRWGEFQETHPLILGPVSTAVPFLVGTDLGEGPVAATIHAMRMAMAVNALGLPAVAVPVGVADGLPQSVQVIGPRYGEHVCLRAAQVIEDRLGTITPIDPR